MKCQCDMNFSYYDKFYKIFKKISIIVNRLNMFILKYMYVSTTIQFLNPIQT